MKFVNVTFVIADTIEPSDFVSELMKTSNGKTTHHINTCVVSTPFTTQKDFEEYVGHLAIGIENIMTEKEHPTSIPQEDLSIPEGTTIH